MSTSTRPFSRATLAAEGPRAPSAYQFFYGHGESAGPLAVLSNWYVLSEPFRDEEGHSFTTSEHYMMYAKAELFGDKEAAEAILKATTARKAKALGRKVRNFDDTVWGERALSLVAEGCELKFAQCEYAREVLLGTEEKILVEAAPRDVVWGIGMGSEHPDRLDPGTWRGQNLLGEALMIVRDRLKDKNGRERGAESSTDRRSSRP